MSIERRYSEDEIAEILDRATEVHATPERGATEPRGGLTLDELADIGDEVGIPRDRIERAAHALDRPPPVSVAETRFLGTRVGVGQAVALERTLTDAEWGRFVGDLRTTFAASGRIEELAGSREWRNGRLQVTVEPTREGALLRMRTLRSVSRPMMAGSLGLGAFLTFVALTAAEDPGGEFMAALIMVGLFLWTWIGTHRWAGVREGQMEALASRLRADMDASDGNEAD